VDCFLIFRVVDWEDYFYCRGFSYFDCYGVFLCGLWTFLLWTLWLDTRDGWCMIMCARIRIE
jgi:hypothetical protein